MHDSPTDLIDDVSTLMGESVSDYAQCLDDVPYPTSLLARPWPATAAVENTG